FGGVGGAGHDREPGVFEHMGEPLPEQGLIFADHDPHGSSAPSVVPAPGRLSQRSRPPRASTRSASPRSPPPPSLLPSRRAPPIPSSPTSTTSWPPVRARRTISSPARACLRALASPSATTKYAVLSTA